MIKCTACPRKFFTDSGYDAHWAKVHEPPIPRWF
jgi:hypothetical protein